MLKSAIKILNETNKPTRSFVRENQTFKQLLQKLDNPHLAFKSIHITGTNGKGSVALKSAYVLEKAGYKTGLYTSPHIFTFMERIKVNRKNIDENYFASSILKIDEIAKNNQLQLSFFQYLTATCFLYFKEQKCDIASIQVGLGGRYDTTNVITPQLSIITSIGIDHEKILGNTRQLIAKEKAGIIKQERPVVIGPYANIGPIIVQAQLQKAKLYMSESPKDKEDFEEQNNNVVRKAMQVLREDRGLTISESHIESGLLIKQPCRMQELPQTLKPSWSKQKRIFFDVGHNPNAISRMLQYYIKNIKKDSQRLIVLFGSSKGKDSNESLKILQEVADVIFFIQADHPRAMDSSQISQYVGSSKYPRKFRILDDGKISSSLLLATSEQKHDNVIICGSFFLMRESWAFFDKKYLQNVEEDMQEQYQMVNPKDK